ncbi:MAG: hypothetical protein WCO30_02645 [bacterium]
MKIKNNDGRYVSHPLFVGSAILFTLPIIVLWIMSSISPKLVNDIGLALVFSGLGTVWLFLLILMPVAWLIDSHSNSKILKNLETPIVDVKPLVSNNKFIKIFAVFVAIVIIGCLFLFVFSPRQ